MGHYFVCIQYGPTPSLDVVPSNVPSGIDYGGGGESFTSQVSISPQAETRSFSTINNKSKNFVTFSCKRAYAWMELAVQE